MIVTAITEDYLPGLWALHRSIQMNSPGIPMACLVYGDDALGDEVANRGITVIMNPEIKANLPTSPARPIPQPVMYSRLIIPELFPRIRRLIWLDVDQVVLKPLGELMNMDLKDSDCAMVEHDTTLAIHVVGSNETRIKGCYAGLIVIDTRQWKRMHTTANCFYYMNNPGELVFQFVVQSVLGWVMRSPGYCHLHPKWQRFGNRAKIPKDACVVHWHGDNVNPWSAPMNNMDLWKQYADTTET